MTPDSEPRPFVPRGIPVDDRRPPTKDELAQMRADLRARAAQRPRPAQQTPETDTERLARARARLEKEQR